jgi:hypothetical protein
MTVYSGGVGAFLAHMTGNSPKAAFFGGTSVPRCHEVVGD